MLSAEPRAWARAVLRLERTISAKALLQRASAHSSHNQPPAAPREILAERLHAPRHWPRARPILKGARAIRPVSARLRALRFPAACPASARWRRRAARGPGCRGAGL